MAHRDIAAIRAVFFLQPFVIGGWFPRIPQVQAGLGLSEGELAIALMGMPIGLLGMLFVGGRIAEKLGTRRLLMVGLGTYLLIMPFPGLAWSGASLFVALICTGVALALAQLSLNVTASEVEKRSERLIMNGAHGFWSVGVLLGSALGALQAELGWPVWLSLAVLASASAIPLLWSALQIRNFTVTASKTSEGRAPIPRKLIAIAVFAFGIAMTEGAMADWAAVYLTQAFDASPGMAGASYTAFALFVALGRFQGDNLKARFAAAALVRAFVLLALFGLAVALISPTLAGAYIGLALLGFGVSIGFPMAVSAASNLPERSSAANVAVLTQMTLCGFLIGPPMIGLLAEATNMRIGLAALFPPLLLSLGLAAALQAQPKSGSLQETDHL